MENILYFLIPIGVIVAIFLAVQFKKKKKNERQKKREDNQYPSDPNLDPLNFTYTTPAGVQISSSVEFSQADKDWQFPIIEEALRVQIETARREAATQGQTFDKKNNLSEFHLTIVKPTSLTAQGAPMFKLRDGREAYGACLGTADMANNVKHQRDSIQIPFHADRATMAENLFEIVANEAEHIILWFNAADSTFPNDKGFYFWESTGAFDSHPIFPNRPRWSGAVKGFHGAATAKRKMNCLNQ